MNPWQYILERKSQNCYTESSYPTTSSSIVNINCYVARQQGGEEVPSRERWIRDTVDYTPPEGIMNEAPKEHEQSGKIRTEILVAWKEAFPVKSCAPMQSMSGETCYIVPLGDATQTSTPKSRGKIMILHYL